MYLPAPRRGGAKDTDKYGEKFIFDPRGMMIKIDARLLDFSFNYFRSIGEEKDSIFCLTFETSR